MLIEHKRRRARALPLHGSHGLICALPNKIIFKRRRHAVTRYPMLAIVRTVESASSHVCVRLSWTLRLSCRMTKDLIQRSLQGVQDFRLLPRAQPLLLLGRLPGRAVPARGRRQGAALQHLCADLGGKLRRDALADGSPCPLHR
eukprot:6197753-Pleurochrysis_carterae.AAC.1